MLATGVEINLRSAGLEDEQLEQLRKLFIDHPGSCPVYLHIRTREQGDVTVRADRGLAVRPDATFVHAIETALGEGHLNILGVRKARPRSPAPGEAEIQEMEEVGALD
jgi:hypothetical protein